MKETKIKKCKKCEALIEVLENCNCKNENITCCNQIMKDLIPNSEEASYEKHIPYIEIKDKIVKIKIKHVMEKEHYIKWIKVITKDKNITKIFKPEEDPELIIPLEEKMIIYSYCNKHGLWKKEI